MPRKQVVEAHPAVAHRGGLATKVRTTRPDPTLYGRIGGRKIVKQIVDGLYDRIENDREIRHLFTTKNLSGERRRVQHFFVEWLGGPKVWNVYRGLVDRHGEKVISARAARVWFNHFNGACCDVGMKRKHRTELLAVVEPITRALVNDDQKCHLSLGCPHTWKPQSLLASKGDSAGVRKLLDKDPNFGQPGGVGIQILLVNAARRGRTEIVKLLLDRGADIDRADGSYTFEPVTAYAIARAKGHDETADYLIERGAIIDIFTAVYLGDVALVEEQLDANPDLLEVEDPAMDLADLTPLVLARKLKHRAVARLLRERGATR